MNNPALYVKSNPFQRRDAQLVLKKYGPQLAPGLAVLDVGCGTGDLTVDILAQACGDFRLLLGVDLSSHMVDFARRNFQTDRIFFDQLDIATTEVSTFRARWGSFDRIYSFYCLHWVKDLNRAVGNLGSLLATGGEMLLVFLAHNPIFEVYQRMAATSRWKVYMEVSILLNGDLLNTNIHKTCLVISCSDVLLQFT
ncbi:jhamt [Cordylochernes scorpioides]|uniref:Jhamt n=1 Tax=Cordylochernes scorpioides TaxID=51811 RepID=A0ABY6LLK3_9ARAC|nr:jhamt [Cordylochernes scorpioides]